MLIYLISESSPSSIHEVRIVVCVRSPDMEIVTRINYERISKYCIIPERHIYGVGRIVFGV